MRLTSVVEGLGGKDFEFFITDLDKILHSKAIQGFSFLQHLMFFLVTIKPSSCHQNALPLACALCLTHNVSSTAVSSAMSLCASSSTTARKAFTLKIAIYISPFVGVMKGS